MHSLYLTQCGLTESFKHFFGILSCREITFVEALILLLMYAGYCTVMKFNEQLRRAIVYCLPCGGCCTSAALLLSHALFLFAQLTSSLQDCPTLPDACECELFYVEEGIMGTIGSLLQLTHSGLAFKRVSAHGFAVFGQTGESAQIRTHIAMFRPFKPAMQVKSRIGVD